jgi:hypothetical protein
VAAHWKLADSLSGVDLVVTTTGSPAQQADGENWSDYVFSASTPCPQSLDAIEQPYPVAEGPADGSTFSDTTTMPGFNTGFPASGSWSVSPSAPAHVCGYVSTGYPTNQVTATTDSPVTAHVPHLNYKAVMFMGRPGTSTVYCNDEWGSASASFTPCQLHGRMVLSVSKKVRRQLGLTSRVLAVVNLAPFDHNEFYAPWKVPAKVLKAIGNYKVPPFPMTMKVTVTSPTPTTFSSTTPNARRGVCGGTYAGACKGYGG